MINFLKTIRILDEDGTASFTSLYLYLGLIICIAQPINEWSVGLLTLILAHTNLKRLSRFKKQVHDQATQALAVGRAEADQAELKLIKDQVQNLMTQASATAAMNQYR